MWPRHYTGFLQNRAIVVPMLILATITSLTGCNDSPRLSKSETDRGGPSSSETVDGPPSLLERLRSKFTLGSNEVPGSLTLKGGELEAKTREEIDKVFRWEYRVVDLSPTGTADELERDLNKLGADGWECFHLNTTDKNLRATCRRRPKSTIAYLKLLPGL